jgi:vacuolar protein sorting-associated protein 16
MMDAPHPTAGWERIGDRFYRKIQLYTAVFDRDLELDNYIVAGAPYGGAIGMVTFPPPAPTSAPLSTFLA